MIRLQTAANLEPDECAGVTDARVSNRMALAALLVSHPLDFWFDVLTPFKLSKGAKQHADGMPAANRVLCPREVARKVGVRIGSGRRRNREDIYGFVVELGDGLVDGIVL